MSLSYKIRGKGKASLSKRLKWKDHSSSLCQLLFFLCGRGLFFSMNSEKCVLWCYSVKTSLFLNYTKAGLTNLFGVLGSFENLMQMWTLSSEKMRDKCTCTHTSCSQSFTRISGELRVAYSPWASGQNLLSLKNLGERRQCTIIF